MSGKMQRYGTQYWYTELILRSRVAAGVAHVTAVADDSVICDPRRKYTPIASISPWGIRSAALVTYQTDQELAQMTLEIDPC